MPGVARHGAGDAPLLTMRGVAKRFPGVQALDRVDLDLVAGEIHGLAGENGSGKSTLVKILAGRYAADEGEILLDGAPAAFGSASAGLRAGVALIAQEVLVHPELTVAENLLSGRAPRRWGVIDWPELRRRAAATLDRLRLDVDPGARLGDLALHLQHMVAIGKMVERSPRILVLDEPTSSLTEEEVATLFGLLRELRDAGTTVVYITHRLREYFELTDRVTILRDGRLVTTRPTAQLDEEELVRLMVGRHLTSIFTRPDAARPVPGGAGAPPLLRVRGLRTAKLRGIDLQVAPGEVVGVAGQAGAGRSSLARTLFGLHAHDGTVELAGRAVRLRSARDAMAAGIAYVPEDRKGAGLVLTMSVGENVTMPQWGRLARAGVQRRGEHDEVVGDAIRRLGIRCPGPATEAGTLSGGNQQKIVIAKWLARQPRLLLLDEPTRGIDVGAKAEIYALIERLAAEGLGVLVFSSELLELLRLSDRIVVLAKGRVAGELPGAQATEESVTALAFRGLEEDAA